MKIVQTDNYLMESAEQKIKVEKTDAMLNSGEYASANERESSTKPEGNGTCGALGKNETATGARIEYVKRDLILIVREILTEFLQIFII